MNKAQRQYPERLLEMEQITPALKEKYDMELQTMIEQPIKGVRKLPWIIATAGGVGFMLLFGTVAIIAPAEFPLLGRLTFAAGAVFGLAWTILGIVILRRGSMNLKTHAPAAAGMGWGLTIIVATFALLTMGNEARESLVGVRMCLAALIFLVPAATFMIHSRIQQSELRTREKLLEIEYRLAELSETIDKEEKN